MIRRLRGEVIDRGSNHLVVDVHGVGYLVTVPSRVTLVVSAPEVDLFVFTRVREDAIQLFGFLEAIDLEIFELLLNVPTIGPVKALGILEAGVEELVYCIQRGEIARLAKLPGVGRKTAERMVVDLKDKFRRFAPAPTTSRPPQGPAKNGEPVRDVESALMNLGYKQSVAEAAAERSIQRLGETAALQDLLREALVQVNRRQ